MNEQTATELENQQMLAMANRIAESATPDEDSRLEVAYAIARHLDLGWPAAKATAKATVIVPQSANPDEMNAKHGEAYGVDWIYATKT